MIPADLILGVIEGRYPGTGEMRICPSEAVELIEEMGLEQLGDPMDVNGWQCDYWLYFESEDESKQFRLSGSMYYGTASLTLCGAEE